MKLRHEVRDGLYGFIEFDNLEKRLIDSEPFQRLRSIHQLAMCYQVYPGATHRRFEHSLGVMEIASRIYDTLFNQRVADDVYERIGEELENDKKAYWRRVVRVAALLHDVGHLPFSHAAEKDLLPPGWNHERLTSEIIRQSGLAKVLHEESGIELEDVVDVSWDIRKRMECEPDLQLSPWKTLLNEIITGNTFGADRIDYLLRDSWHAGVAYGRFDPHRLINGLRVVVDPANEQIALGLDIGAIHAAEALLLARYFMYTQVYFHDVRRAYDLHLRDFLQAWLPDRQFPVDWPKLMKVTDNEVLVALRKAAANRKARLHSLAVRVIHRQHYRTVYTLLSTHKEQRPTIFDDIRQFALEVIGEDNVRCDRYGPTSETNDFLVLTDDGSVVSSLWESGVIRKNIPPIEVGFVFVNPERCVEAKRRIDRKLKQLLAKKQPISQKEGHR